MRQLAAKETYDKNGRNTIVFIFVHVKYHFTYDNITFGNMHTVQPVLFFLFTNVCKVQEEPRAEAATNPRHQETPGGREKVTD